MANANNSPTQSGTEDKTKSKEGSDINLGSLLRLFKSMHFDTWMAVSYLYKYPQNTGIQQYLANEFYKLPDDDIEFYLGQLCMFVVYFKDTAAGMQRFLLDKASKAVHFALKISWMFCALGEHDRPSQLERCNNLKIEAQHALMNRRRPVTIAASMEKGQSIDTDNEEALLAFAISKKERCDYFDALRDFIDNLGQISNRLRTVPLEHRGEQLKIELLNVNAKIRKNAGMYMPMVSASGKHACIVNIPPQEAVVLSSRDRAPYLIYFEVIESETPASSEDLHEFVKKYEQTFAEIERGSHPTTPRGGNSSGSKTPVFDKSEKLSVDKIHDKLSGNTLKVDKLSNSAPPSTAPSSISLHVPILTTTTTTTSTSTTTTTSEKKHREYKHGHDNWVVLEPQKQGEGSPTHGNNNGSKDSKEGTPPVNPRKKSILFVRERWPEKFERIRKNSAFGKLDNWGLQSVIVKYGDDCRQERMALQLIRQFYNIWKAAKIPLYIRPYNILVLSPVSCLIEVVTNSMSVHQLKKDHDGMTIGDFYKEKCGGTETQEYKQAQANFIESTAAYSLVTYLLQIKDRHNGNILMDMDGHIVHIDFGFMLSNSPGSLNFENSPFKITQEYIDFMGGMGEGMYQYFKVLVTTGFMEVRKHADKLLGLVEMALQTDARLPCLKNGQKAVDDFRDRLVLGLTERELEEHVSELINHSVDNWRTKQYDHFQFLTNGILY